MAVRGRIFVRSLMESSVEEVTGGLYHLDMGKVRIDLLTGHLSASNIRLQLDVTKYEQLRKKDSLPDLIGILEIKSLKLTGVNFKYTRKHGKRFGFKQLRIDEPELILLRTARPKNDSGLNKPVPEHREEGPNYHTLYDFISPYFDEFLIADLTLTNGNVFLLKQGDGISNEASLSGLNIDARNFTINSDRTLNNSIFYTDDIVLAFDELNYYSPDGMYRYFAGSSVLDIRENRLSLSELGFRSVLPKWEFAEKAPKHADWFDLQVGQVDFKGIDLMKLLDKQELYADSLFVNTVLFQNYKNNKIPIEHHIVPMIYTARQNLPLPFSIDLVHVTDMEIVYEELAKDRNDPGRVSFTHLDGVFMEYTNIPSRPEQTTTLYASGRFMGEGEFEAQVVLPVDTLYDKVEMKVKMGAMNMIALNPVIEPMAPLRINGGFIQELDFTITANSEKADLAMKLLYNDLSVKILLPAGGGKLSESAVLSFFANGLIERNNPGANGEVRLIKAEKTRDPMHSSFNYLWKTLFAGLVQLVGYTDQRQEMVQWLSEELE